MPTSRGYVRQIRGAFFGVLIVYLLFIAVLTVTQRDMMYFPPAGISEEQMGLLADFRQIEVQTDDGLSLRGYFVPPADNKKPVLILFHGNGSHPSWEVFKTQALKDKGYGILLASYRGYDGNQGSPSEAGLFVDGKAYAGFIKADYPQNPLILYGSSLGAAIAVDVALHTSPQALILEVPFFSAVDVAVKFYPYIPFMNTLVKDPYRNDEKITKIESPLLFLLAGKDEVVSLESGMKLFDLANEPKRKVIYTDARHADVYNHGAEADVAKFLQEVVK